jgi:SAM-dependent methyltransferase
MTAAAKVPDFHGVLSQPGLFLDVGTGAAWLPIEVARCWPGWRVVGIDRWQPALDLARQNVAASALQNSIELCCQDVCDMEDEHAFSVARLPGPFLSAEVVSRSLARVWKSLVPGGWLAFSLFAPQQIRWGEALTALKVMRNGGHPWKKDELEAILAALSLVFPRRRVSCVPPFGMALRALMARFKMAAVDKV